MTMVAAGETMRSGSHCPWCGWSSKDTLALGFCPECGQRLTGSGLPGSAPAAGDPAAGEKLAEKTILIDSPLITGVTTTRAQLAARTMPEKIGHYELLSVLGRGGMGTVYLAYDPLLNREVALKLLTHADPDKTAEESARLLSEAMLTGRLDSAGIIPIYSIEFDPAHGYFYTMRYLQGRTLQEILKELKTGNETTREAFPQRRLLTIFQRACEAVAFAHKNHVIHRDLKPGNIMITHFGEVYVVDWGLAKDIDPVYVSSRALSRPEVSDKYAHCMKAHLNATRNFLILEQHPQTPSAEPLDPETVAYPEHLTEAHQIVGTPAYLSPEQCLRDSALSPASDVYSLGVILYEMLTGQLPVDSDELFEMFRKLTSGEIVPIRSHPESYRIPKTLCDMAEKALALKPAKRFADAGELNRELTEYLEGRPPLKKICADPLNGSELKSCWKPSAPVRCLAGQGVLIKQAQSLLCRVDSLGDFRCTAQLMAVPRSHAWSYAIRLCECRAQGGAVPRYEIRLGVAGRAYIELIRDNRRVQRRLDIRLQRGRFHRLRVELSGELVRVFVDDVKFIDYRELFPQAGGAVEFAATASDLQVSDFELWSRGAPLNLSTLALPDQLFRSQQFAAARTLYRNLSESHPDREEGLLAGYKAGLCSVELKDLPAAFAEFARLEETVFDHCCALGLARIGSIDGNIDWAWEALKQGYRRHRRHEIGAEMWFALLELIESLDQSKLDEKLKRYHELLDDLQPTAQEAGQLAVDLLETAAHAGLARLRKEATALLAKHRDQSQLRVESVLALWRSGINLDVLPAIERTLEDLEKQPDSPLPPLRGVLLKVELLLARGQTSAARELLLAAAGTAGDRSGDADWIRDWSLFTLHLQEEYKTLIAQAGAAIDAETTTEASPLAYARLIRSIALIALRQPGRASTELCALATAIDLWGQAARAILTHMPANEFQKSIDVHNAVQSIEALFLIGESHRLSGRNDLARKYLEACMRHPTERAMIRQLAQPRLNNLTQ